jgi:hypothetical protein
MKDKGVRFVLHHGDAYLNGVSISEESIRKHMETAQAAKEFINARKESIEYRGGNYTEICRLASKVAEAEGKLAQAVWDMAKEV